MARSSIEWLARPGTIPESWNPVTGCTKVSAGCAHCYAETIAGRFWPTQYGWSRPFTDVRCHEDRLDIPARWRKPRTCFVCSMSDLFHERVPDSFLLKVRGVLASVANREHTFIILTKRPARMRQWGALYGSWGPHVWLGVTAENQATADERIPLLLDTPAAVRFASCEPLLGPVDLADYIPPDHDGHRDPRGDHMTWLDWVIVGGESGPKARPCDVAWIRDIATQCHRVEVPVFVKQLGTRPYEGWESGPDGEPNEPYWLHNVTGKGADPAEWPADLRVREWPEVKA